MRMNDPASPAAHCDVSSARRRLCMLAQASSSSSVIERGTGFKKFASLRVLMWRYASPSVILTTALPATHA